MAKLSTHVLDLSRGKPAAGLRIRLFAIEGETRRLLNTATTNADGRIDAADGLEPGVYEFEFGVGDYFGLTGGQPTFLGEVLVRFGVSDMAGKYHVPLLVSPYGYSTYRGS
jgi:5-hydroxyisourate hydrolase